MQSDGPPGVSMPRYLGSAEITDAAEFIPDQQEAQGPDRQEEVELDKSSADQATLAFAANVTAHRNCANDIDASANWNSGDGLFTRWEDKVSGALDAAYPTYLHMLNGGNAVIEEALRHPTFAERERQLKKSNPALIALQLSAKPADGPQRAMCSDYANILIWAAQNRVDPSDFVERMSKVTLTHCKGEIRAKRKSDTLAKTQGTVVSPKDEMHPEPSGGETAAMPASDRAVAEDDAAETVRVDPTPTPGSTRTAETPQEVNQTHAVRGHAADAIDADATPTSGSEPIAETLQGVGDQPRVARKLTLTIVNNKGKTREFACPLEGKEVKALFAALDRQTSLRSALTLLKLLVAALEDSKHTTNKKAVLA